jgi:hypothetical protein
MICSEGLSWFWKPLKLYRDELMTVIFRFILCLGLFGKKHMHASGLEITAGQRTMTGQKCLLTGHFFTSPVIVTGHILMPSNVIC